MDTFIEVISDLFRLCFLLFLVSIPVIIPVMLRYTSQIEERQQNASMIPLQGGDAVFGQHYYYKPGNKNLFALSPEGKYKQTSQRLNTCTFKESSLPSIKGITLSGNEKLGYYGKLTIEIDDKPHYFSPAPNRECVES